MRRGYWRRVPSHLLARVPSTVAEAVRDGMMGFVQRRFVSEELFRIFVDEEELRYSIGDVHPRVAEWLITEYNPPSKTQFLLVASSLDPELLSLVKGVLVKWNMVRIAVQSGDLEILKYAISNCAEPVEYVHVAIKLAIRRGFAPEDVNPLVNLYPLRVQRGLRQIRFTADTS